MWLLCVVLHDVIPGTLASVGERRKNKPDTQKCVYKTKLGSSWVLHCTENLVLSEVVFSEQSQAINILEEEATVASFCTHCSIHSNWDPQGRV